MKIRLINPGNFGYEETHGLYPTWKSDLIEWTEDESEITIWVDTPGARSIQEQFDIVTTQVLYSKSKYKILALLEPFTMCPHNYEWAINNSNLFDIIISTYIDFGNSEKFKYIPGGCRSFIRPEERFIYDKKYEITSIVSSRNHLEGHKLRHRIKSHYQSKDSCPIDYLNPPIGKKVDGLRDYRYELVIENEDGTNFSEKLIDSMLCGCLPIYWTRNDLSYLSMFDSNGIVTFSNFDELIRMVDSGMFCKEHYDSKIDSIKNNFEVAKKFVSLGDVLWNYALKEFIERNESNL